MTGPAGVPSPTPMAEEAGPVNLALLRLARIHRGILGSLLRPLGLFPGQELMLLQPWDKRGFTQSELVDQLGLDASTVTKMLQRLERDGWVARVPSSIDARAMVVTLTAEGRKLQRKVRKVWATFEAQATSDLSDREQASLLKLLAKVENGTLAAG
jgi:DNA-binding MarR family transcriptional regulator